MNKLKLRIHYAYKNMSTLREEILAGRKFGGKKIWRIWRNLIWQIPIISIFCGWPKTAIFLIKECVYVSW